MPFQIQVPQSTSQSSNHRCLHFHWHCTLSNGMNGMDCWLCGTFHIDRHFCIVLCMSIMCVYNHTNIICTAKAPIITLTRKTNESGCALCWSPPSNELASIANISFVSAERYNFRWKLMIHQTGSKYAIDDCTMRRCFFFENAFISWCIICTHTQHNTPWK